MKCPNCQATRDSKRLKRLHRSQAFVVTVLAGVLLMQGVLTVAVIVTTERLRDVERVAATK